MCNPRLPDDWGREGARSWGGGFPGYMGATFKATESRWPGLDPEMNLKP